MYRKRLLSIVFFGFSFILLSNSLALASRQCTREVSHEGRIVTITTDCTASYDRTTEHFWDRWYYNSRMDDLFQKVQDGWLNLQEKLANLAQSQDNSRQMIANTKEKEREASDAQELKLQQQRDQVEDQKERLEMQRQQQEDRAK